MTVIKMVHVTITSFHINLYANNLVDVEPPPLPETLLIPRIQNFGKYTPRKSDTKRTIMISC